MTGCIRCWRGCRQDTIIDIISGMRSLSVVILWSFGFCFQTTVLLVSAQTAATAGAEITNTITFQSHYQSRKCHFCMHLTEGGLWSVLLVCVLIQRAVLDHFLEREKDDCLYPRDSPRQAWFQRRHSSCSHSVITEEWKHLCNHFWTVISDKHPAYRGSKGTIPLFLSWHFASSFGKSSRHEILVTGSR